MKSIESLTQSMVKKIEYTFGKEGPSGNPSLNTGNYIILEMWNKDQKMSFAFLMSDYLKLTMIFLQLK